MKKSLEEIFSSKMFDVEHALHMFASSFVVLPASAIYDEVILKQFEYQIKTCHIYFIGLLPKVDFVGATQEKNDLITKFQVSGNFYELDWPLPGGASLCGNLETGQYVLDASGKKIFPSVEVMLDRLNREKGPFDFRVLYIGQAFGDNGSRNAIDRLKKHETLQKISIQGISPDQVLTLLMLEIVPANRVITMFNPWAKDTEHSDERIIKGLDKLFDTNEAERITLYEASLIRYFQPKFNKDFKNSFPSTNMKTLSDCYMKDIAAVISEICIDELPFRLFTESVEVKPYHIAHFDLHNEASRKVFFQSFD